MRSGISKGQVASILLVVLGAATIALATWTSEWSGLTHVNSSTCNTEACRRHCRVCCGAFWGPNDPEKWDCFATCDALPLCSDETLEE